MPGRLRFRHAVRAETSAVAKRLRHLRDIARWLPAVASCRLLAEEGSVAVYEFRWSSGRRPTTFEVIYVDALSLRFTEIDRLAGQGLEGRLRIEPSDTATSTIEVDCKLPGWTSALPWSKTRHTLREGLARAIEALERDVLDPASRPKPEVDVMSVDPEIRVRIDGRDYRLVPT